MKSITIHNLDDDLCERLQEQAQAHHTSLNQTIKSLLATALGGKVTDKPKHWDDFKDFVGAWTPEEAAAFDRRVADACGQVDPEDWK